MVGQDTHNTTGVEKEVGETYPLKKPIFQIRPQGYPHGEVRGAGEVIP